MANNCWNYVAITGDKKRINTIQKHFKNYDNTKWFTEFGDAFFNKKRNYEGQEFDFYYEYGTKWWDFDWNRESDTELIVQGDTAWSPPLKLLKDISKKFNVKVYAEWQEYGMDFAGRATWNKGLEKELWNCSAQRMDLEHMGLAEFYDYQSQFMDDNSTIFDFLKMLSADVIEYIGEKGLTQIKEWFENDKERLATQNT